MVTIEDVVLEAARVAERVVHGAASERAPTASWGTTVNCSVPRSDPIDFAQVSRGALGGYLVEAGVSAADSAIAWLASLVGQSHDELLASAACVPPGAGGVLALPWLHGARAPWWQPGTYAAFLGITNATGPAELARALVEGIAFDAARSISLIAPETEMLMLAGGGAGDDLWRDVLGAVTGLPLVRRALDDAASVGARIVVAAARGDGHDVDAINPVVARDEPDRDLVGAYAELRKRSDAAAKGVLEL